MISPGIINSIALWLILAGIASAAAPEIRVVYPKVNSAIGAVDSSFIFGSVTPGSRLDINGHEIPVHRDGGYIAFLPLNPGAFVFHLTASHGQEISRLDWPVSVPIPRKSLGYDSLHMIPLPTANEQLVLANGDRLTFAIDGTPGCVAWCSLPGYRDSIPLVELLPQIQPYWGETVFGVGAVPDSLKVRGHYEGYLEIGPEPMPDSCRIYYHLHSPGIGGIVDYFLSRPHEQIDFDALTLLRLGDTAVVDSSVCHVLVNPPTYPRMVEFTDSVQIMRVGPRKGYLAVFQPAGVQAWAVGAHDDWLKLRLSATQYGWVNKNSVTGLDPACPPGVSYLRAVRSYLKPDNLTIEFPLKNRHPFRIEEEDEYTLAVYLYGVNSDTDWIRYDFGDKDLRLATWKQVEPDLYCFTLHFNRPIWGYDTCFDGSIFKLQVNKPPQDIASLNNKVIVVDPGHSPDPGAIGPTGLKESVANLTIALALKKELEKKGARVIMTRDDMSAVTLYQRPEIAVASKADLFVSVHNNALPDGVDPLTNNGVSSYYYHPHSIALARSIQAELIDRLDLNDYGLYHGNLAVNRPTQYPAVLVECAFIILPDQEALLKTEKFQKKTARAIRVGIEKFLKAFPRD